MRDTYKNLHHIQTHSFRVLTFMNFSEFTTSYNNLQGIILHPGLTLMLRWALFQGTSRTKYLDILTPSPLQTGSNASVCEVELLKTCLKVKFSWSKLHISHSKTSSHTNNYMSKPKLKSFNKITCTTSKGCYLSIHVYLYVYRFFILTNFLILRNLWVETSISLGLFIFFFPIHLLEISWYIYTDMYSSIEQ